MGRYPKGKTTPGMMKVAGVGIGKNKLTVPQTAAGDNYGLGVKAKIGKMRGDSVGYRPVSKKMLSKPPRSTV